MQGSPTSLSARSLAVAQVDALTGTMPVRRACLEAGVKFVNYYRWKASAEQSQGLQEVKAVVKKGRKPLFELTEAETRRLRFWRLVKGSIPLAMECAIAESTQGDETPYFEALRAMQSGGEVVNETHRKARQSVEGNAKLDEAKARALKAYWQKFVEARKVVTWPLSIQRACRVSEDEEAAFRGKKALQDRSGSERRGAFIVDEDGKRLPWFAGAIWCSDDMSVNDPFRFHDAASGSEMLGRQVLFTTDAYSLNFLGASHVGRDRDSYRAEDIARHFAELVDEHGLPVIWRVERGRWDNNFINGCIVPDEVDSDGEDLRWGGLDAIIHMAVKFNSRGKEIEGCFNLLQSLMDHGGDGRTLSIGRNRGEFEAATKLMLRADRDAEALAKFWNIEQSAEQVMQAMRLFNTRPKKRESFGNKAFTPAELWSQHVKRPCPQNERWRFMAVKTAARIWNGLIEVKVKHYPTSFRFRVNGAGRIGGAQFVDGHKVMIAFDPHDAWAGCHVVNRDRSARNRDGWGWLERIGVADFMADAPQEDLSGGYSPGQKRAGAQVRTEFRSIIAGTAFEGRRRSHAQDSLGNALAVRTGAAETGGQECPRSLPAPTEPVRCGLSEGRLTPRRVITQADDEFDEDEELEALALR